MVLLTLYLLLWFLKLSIQLTPTFSQLEWRNYEATIISRTTIALRNVNNDAKEQLELRDRIIKVCTAFTFFSHIQLLNEE